MNVCIARNGIQQRGDRSGKSGALQLMDIAFDVPINLELYNLLKRRYSLGGPPATTRTAPAVLRIEFRWIWTISVEFRVVL